MKKRSRFHRRLAGAAIALRRLLGRLERGCPRWVEGIPAWLSSMMAHALVLVLLGLMILIGGFGADHTRTEIDVLIPQLHEDLTAIRPGEVAGDPLTKEKSEEAPSLVLDPEKKDASGVNQPEAPKDARLVVPIHN